MSQPHNELFSKLPKSFQVLARFWREWEQRKGEQNVRVGGDDDEKVQCKEVS